MSYRTAREKANALDHVLPDRLPTCPRCGDLCEPDALICPECGAKLNLTLWDRPTPE